MNSAERATTSPLRRMRLLKIHPRFKINAAVGTGASEARPLLYVAANLRYRVSGTGLRPHHAIEMFRLLQSQTRKIESFERSRFDKHNPLIPIRYSVSRLLSAFYEKKGRARIGVL